MTVKLYNEEVIASGNYTNKASEDKREGGLIENWSIIPWMGTGNLVVMGRIVEDTQWGTGGPIRTSLIYSIDEEAGVLETLNTRYKLGTKAEPQV